MGTRKVEALYSLILPPLIGEGPVLLFALELERDPWVF